MITLYNYWIINTDDNLGEAVVHGRKIIDDDKPCYPPHHFQSSKITGYSEKGGDLYVKMISGEIVRLIGPRRKLTVSSSDYAKIQTGANPADFAPDEPNCDYPA